MRIALRSSCVHLEASLCQGEIRPHTSCRLVAHIPVSSPVHNHSSLKSDAPARSAKHPGLITSMMFDGSSPNAIRAGPILLSLSLLSLHLSCLLSARLDLHWTTHHQTPLALPSTHSSHELPRSGPVSARFMYKLLEHGARSGTTGGKSWADLARPSGKVEIGTAASSDGSPETESHDCDKIFTRANHNFVGRVLHTEKQTFHQTSLGTRLRFFSSQVHHNFGERRKPSCGKARLCMSSDAVRPSKPRRVLDIIEPACRTDQGKTG